MSWVHLHLALNHIPVLGTLFVGILLCTALLKGNDELQRLSHVWFVALALISIPIKFTGDFAFEAVAESEWVSVERALSHEAAADQATTGMFWLGLAAAFGLFRGRRGRPIPGWVVGLVGILALVTFLLMARTANLGGQLRHQEIRPGSHKGTEMSSTDTSEASNFRRLRTTHPFPTGGRLDLQTIGIEP